MISKSVIPKSLYKTEKGIQYVTKALLEAHHTPEEIQRFAEWFSGQTGMITEAGELGFYVWDYERWVDGGMPTQQGVDWD